MFKLTEWYEFLVKLIIPAIIGISIELAIKSKREKMTFFRILLSYIVGIGGAYLSYGFVKANISDSGVAIAIAIISMSTEKIAEYIIYKWNVDLFLTSIIDAIRQAIIKIINPK